MGGVWEGALNSLKGSWALPSEKFRNMTLKSVDFGAFWQQSSTVDWVYSRYPNF